MDPQQRLLLEIGYSAAHSAGMRRASLLGREMGIFVGIMNVDFTRCHAGAMLREPTLHRPLHKSLSLSLTSSARPLV